MSQVKQSKSQLLKKGLPALKQEAEVHAWAAINQYFDGAGNGPEAKIACIVLTALVREHQATNHSHQLSLIEQRLSLTTTRKTLGKAGVVNRNTIKQVLLTINAPATIGDIVNILDETFKIKAQPNDIATLLENNPDMFVAQIDGRWIILKQDNSIDKGIPTTVNHEMQLPGIQKVQDNAAERIRMRK